MTERQIDAANGKDLQRASDVDRDKAMTLLQRAVAEGSLELAEFSGRADQVLAARTWGEVEAVLADLPCASLRELPDPPLLTLRTTNGRLRQRGVWAVPERIVAHCGIGRIWIDFTDASCRRDQVLVDVTCTSAGKVILIVPRGWAVRVEQLLTTRGRVINRATEPHRPGAPLIRLSGDIGSGRIKIKHPRAT